MDTPLTAALLQGDGAAGDFDEDAAAAAEPGGGPGRSQSQGPAPVEPRPTAATPMENPHCSCKPTRVFTGAQTCDCQDSTKQRSALRGGGLVPGSECQEQVGAAVGESSVILTAPPYVSLLKQLLPR